MDPDADVDQSADADPDPAVFVSDLQDVKKNSKFLFFTLLSEGTFTSFFKDRKS
jgi:hypothetical protein